MRGKKKAEKAALIPEINAATVSPDTAVDAPSEKVETAPAAKKRGGRKPMTAAEKEAAAKKRAEEKAKADRLTPALFLQYQGDEIDTAKLIEAAKADYKAKHKRTPITDMQLYLKPEERAVYYVVNGKPESGKITY